MEDTDAFRYSTGQIDGADVGGQLDASSFLPPEVPSHWVVYFSVADADASCALVTDLGGSVVGPAQETPFGRIADVADPSGVKFRLHQVLPGGS